ncbi:MAG TPA: CDP-alcohol phosphatidyltransferase family protein [Anaerolineae bacterium]|nr:CDP-alcohol phosphatidyltransferase family protein [Anaerolineae bacterium]HQK13724.1 CDP-alcohol phosphatidyltransferase family protein [Anaerolineae bacterium]
MVANLITLSRIPVLALIIFLLYQPAAMPRFIAAPLIIVLIAMDSFDGVVARRRGETSLLGSVLDIAADRTVEFLLWVVFAHLRLIPVLFPLIVLTRGTFVDAVRAVAPSKGLTPFEMMRSPLGRFLVKSPWLRTPFAIAKAVAFFFLALTHGLAASGSPALATVNTIAQVNAWVALILCLLRGLPVLIEAPRLLQEEPHQG